MTAQTITKAGKPAKPIINESDIRQCKAGALEAKHLYTICQRRSKEVKHLAALFRWREELLLACGGANDRFAVEWRDVMEAR